MNRRLKISGLLLMLLMFVGVTNAQNRRYEDGMYYKRKYPVQVNVIGSGTVTYRTAGESQEQLKGQILEGEDVFVGATPDNHYHLEYIHMNGSPIEDMEFEMPKSSVLIEAKFAPNKYTVSKGNVTNGTISLSDQGEVLYNTEVRVIATPNEGYILDKIFVNGRAISENKFNVEGNSEVTATFKKIEYNVSVGNVTNGRVTLSHNGKVAFDTDVTVTATPDNGYNLSRILVNNAPISGNTFKVKGNSVVTAEFTKKMFTVTKDNVEHGTVTLSHEGEVPFGTEITVTTKPDEGYEIDKILINGEPNTTGKFIVTGNTTVKVTFKTKKYTVSKGVVNNGSVALSHEGQVAFDTDVTVTATPDNGYNLSRILVNNAPISGNMFKVKGNSVVTAEFTKKMFTVTKDNVEHGTVTLSHEGEVPFGTEITIKINPDEGYEIDKILINGEPNTTGKFVVTGNTTVKVTFKTKKYTVSKGVVNNGSVALSHEGQVDFNTDVTVTATPDNGYNLSRIFVNNTPISGNTFKVKGNSVVTAEFSKKMFMVTKGDVEHGIISLDHDGQLPFGTEVVVSSIPELGYSLDKIYVNGKAIEGDRFNVDEDSEVTAIFVKKTFTISKEESLYGVITIIPNETVEYGTEITINAKANDGYRLIGIYVNDQRLNDGVNTYTVTENIRVRADFEQIPIQQKYNVSIKPGIEHGMITLSESGLLDHGTVVEVFANADNGYVLSHILVNGIAIEGNEFKVLQNTVVDAVFTRSLLNVTKGKTENGSFALSQEGSVTFGTEITVTPVPDSGYETDKVMVNGKAIEGNTFTVNEDSEVTVLFRVKRYNVEVEKPSNGNMTLSQEGLVEHGTIIMVTVTPDKGYKLDAIVVNGKVIEGDSFTVLSDSRVSAIFKAEKVEVEKDGDWVIFTVPEGFIGTDARLYDVSGRLLRKYSITTNKVKVSTYELPTAVYIMNFNKDTSIKFKVKH